MDAYDLYLKYLFITTFKYSNDIDDDNNKSSHNKNGAMLARSVGSTAEKKRVLGGAKPYKVFYWGGIRTLPKYP